MAIVSLVAACATAPEVAAPDAAADAPSSGVLVIEPAAPTTLDTLTALLDGAPAPKVRWEKDGVDVGLSQPTVPADLTERGETWRALSTLPDGQILAAEVVIGDSPPTCSGVMVEPGSDGLTCHCVDRFDADAGDPMTDTCAFLVDGAPAGSEGACLLPSSAAKKGQSVSCVLQPGDGLLEGPATASPGLSAPNRPPVLLTVTIGPGNANVSTSIECSGEGEDPDGDAVSFKMRWFVNGYEDTSVTTATVLAKDLVRDPSGETAHRGDTVRCRVRATDGEATSDEAGSATLSLVNAAPVASPPTVEPTVATETDPLTCAPGAVIDADGDPVTVSFSWVIGGALGPNGATITGASFDKGQPVVCLATPYDGTTVGNVVASTNTVVVANTLPAIDAATIAPAAVHNGDTLACGAVGWTDPDPGDMEAIAWSWHTAAGPIEGATAQSLVVAGLAPGTSVWCRATPINGAEAGESKDSAPATIENSPPALGGAALGPTQATAASVLTCTAFGYADPDGDPAVLAYTWEKNGQVLTAESGATLAGVFQKGDAIRCLVTPGDGLVTGTPVASKPLKILNSAPMAAAVVVVPAEGAPCDVFTCQVGAVEDPDLGDTPSLAFRWEKNGAPTEVAGSTFPGAAATSGDVLQCFVIASDGSAGPEVASTTAAVVNTPPAADAVLLSPATPLPGDALDCQPIGFHDAECDLPADFVFEWTADGKLVPGQAGATLIASGYAVGTTFTCTARPTDGVSVGAPVASNAVTLAAPPEDAPIVAALQLIVGGVGCITVGGVPAEIATYAWQVNGGAEFTAGAALPPTAVHDCDRIRCRATTVAGALSNASEILLPVGPACDDENPCTAASCHPSGGCLSVPAAAACDDGDACTEGDTCQGGLCQPGGPATCDDGDPCTDATCVPGTGCVPAPNTAPCDADGSKCTAGDACSAGTCLPGAVAQCDDQNPCTADGCDSLAGCTATPAAGSCDDQSECTVADTCDGGVCGGVYVPDETPCAASQGHCLSGACAKDVAPAIVALTMWPKEPHAGDLVTCVATAADADGWPAQVTISWSWTVDGAVVEGAAGPTLAGGFARGQVLACRATAFDGLLESAPSVASAVVANAPPVFMVVPHVLAADGGPASADASLLCAFEALDPDGDSTQATYLWHVGGALVIGASSPTLPASKVVGCDHVTCDVTATDGAAVAKETSSPTVLPPGLDCGSNPCLDYGCKPQGGCLGTPNTAACSDGSLCTVDDACQDGACKGTSVVCDDGNPCTTDTCDPATGCQAAPNSAPCSDGSLCSEDDTCSGGLCIPGKPPACVDSLACMTQDTCSPAEGCLAQAPAPSDFLLGLITKKAGGVVEVPLDAQPIEIVQGPQGGIHLVGSFQATLPAEVTWSPATVRIEAETREPCCAAGTQVGSAFYAASALFKSAGAGNVYVSGSMPVPFFKTAAKEFADKTCCLSFKVSVLPQSGNGEPIFVSFARHVFTCVDKE